MGRKLCIAIAVSAPQDLDALPGAIPSAQRIARWARSQDYDVELVTDEDKDNPVTCARLADILHRKLGKGGHDRLIISFAGHGLIRGGADEYWLLNNWRQKATEAVNYLKLRDRLGTYRPRQLAIINDACRSLPHERAKWVEGNGVVDIMDYVEAPVQVATLNATRSAQPAYATPLGAEEAYCFFSQVLANALEGNPEDVVETAANGEQQVFNDRLFSVVEREVQQLASRYQRRQVPDLQGSWRSPQHARSKIPALPKAPEPFIVPTAAELEEVSTRSALIPDVEQAQEVRRQRLERQLSFAPDPSLEMLSYQDGVIVNGAIIKDAVTWPDFPVRFVSPHIISISESRTGAASILLELNDRSWVGAAAYRGFSGIFQIDEDGAKAYLLRSAYEGGTPAVPAIVAAALGADLGDPFALAAKLRDGKHADPVLGALAAYVYARAGWIDEVRRLCYFYGERGQPVPFDAVLLARVPLERDENGQYIAQIPAVHARKPRHPEEESRAWTYHATRGCRAVVAGHFPWLRQGWALLEDDFRPELRKLATFAAGLRASPFTSFKPREGAALADALSKGEI